MKNQEGLRYAISCRRKLQATAIFFVKAVTTHDSRLTTHDSRLTTHDSRLTTHVSRFTLLTTHSNA
jgi:hypothetical protein